ncbi:transcriptional regulator, TetR family [Amycolatopsis marina]|uniref:Transcriptional regulator, TetR family n=1 Tax=Amycolatopsis marina TaxID=490629 RepID=A0A1I1CLS8_9PSEU|nr:TetR/AcrR family transcriptional regulator C-terminal domain-containing protein [Amycolatopsis marina]SFB63484.1 transcriptional regulator, TetR family [Amycolatopsis marina]
MGVLAGQGDAAVSMALLWGETGSQSTRTAPGPRPALSVEAIVEAAIAVADTETIAGLSMRAVAERLGRTSMALYTYVPGKAELLDLMYDRVHAELAGDHDGGEGWRAAVTSWATELRSFYLRHPWVLQVSYARPVLGPHEQAVLETLLGILFETGLPAPILRAGVNSLFNHIRGSAQTAAEARQAANATGVSDQEWWSSRSALLQEVAPGFAERFPHSVRLARETAPSHRTAESWQHELDEVFAVGLSILLDGIEAGHEST